MIYKNKMMLMVFIVLTGCEQIIDLDLNESQPVLVIQGDLSVTDGKLSVLISQTGSFFDTHHSGSIRSFSLSRK